MPFDPTDLIAALPEASTPVSFADLLSALHARRYTGAVTFHFFSGQPNCADLPQEPIRFRLASTAAPLDIPK